MNGRNCRLAPWPVVLTLLIACGGGDGTAGAADDPVAEIGSETITVNEATTYMQRSAFGVNRNDVVEALDEMIDVELVLQRARVTYAFTPAESLQVTEWNNLLTINQFREDVMWADARVDEAALRAWYDENVNEEVRARHILIGVPQDAEDDVREAARQKADSLLQLALAGGDFARLASDNSEDQGSRGEGGSLGFFGRGRMVEPFERAAFETPVGKVTPNLVETQFGYHVIKVEERTKRSFDELREEITEQLERPERQQVEQVYITKMMESSGIEFYEDNVDRLLVMVVDLAAANPSDEERALELATFDGGAVLLGEIYGLFRILPEANRRQIAGLDQTQMIQALSQLVQQRMLLARAEQNDIVLNDERQGQLDTRVDALYVESYLREAAAAQLEISDEEVERYYEEHREFYRDQTLDGAREQIRQALVRQRMDAVSAPEAQRELVRVVADSMMRKIDVVRYEERFPSVLDALRVKYEELGQVVPTTTRAERVEQTAQQPPPGAAQGSSDVSSTP